jgi:hypothetical protein
MATLPEAYSPNEANTIPEPIRQSRTTRTIAGKATGVGGV